MLLAFACFRIFMPFQLDVKSAFLNGYILKEFYIKQPFSFESHNFSNYVFKLKQALKAWYERLNKFLILKGFNMSKIDSTLFLKYKNHNLIIIQIYVNDILFGANNKSLCKEFEHCIYKEIEMTKMRELAFLLRRQIKQENDGIFINQVKYNKDLIKKV